MPVLTQNIKLNFPVDIVSDAIACLALVHPCVMSIDAPHGQGHSLVRGDCAGGQAVVALAPLDLGRRVATGTTLKGPGCAGAHDDLPV